MGLSLLSTPLAAAFASIWRLMESRVRNCPEWGSKDILGEKRNWGKQSDDAYDPLIAVGPP